MPVAVRSLPPELAEKAKVELFEDPKKLEDSIQHLKEWIAIQPHLIARTEDQWLVAFLRGSKFSLERTKEKLDLYYSLKTLVPEFQSINYRHPKFMEIVKLGVNLFLPKSKSLTDPRVVILSFAAFSPGQFTMPEVMTVGNTLKKILYMEDDIFTVNGAVSIIDMKGATMSHFTQMTPLMMKKIVVAGQDAAPMKMKGAHYFHMPSSLETLFNLVKTFLNEKTGIDGEDKRKIKNVWNSRYLHPLNISQTFEGHSVFMTSNLCNVSCSLYYHVSKDVLPAEYGGNDYWAKKVEEYSEWLDEEEKYGTDESKRPGNPKTNEDMFGIEGSFRQLQVD